MEWSGPGWSRHLLSDQQRRLPQDSGSPQRPTTSRVLLNLCIVWTTSFLWFHNAYTHLAFRVSLNPYAGTFQLTAFRIAPDMASADNAATWSGVASISWVASKKIASPSTDV